MNCFNQLLIHVEKLLQSTSADFNVPHDLCINSNKFQSSNLKKENSESSNEFGSTSSLDEQSQASEPNQQTAATGDRLLQLIVKGILYENCSKYCEQIATSNTYDFSSTKKDMEEDEEDEEEKLDQNKNKVLNSSMNKANILNPTNEKPDLKLFTWLMNLPKETFNFYLDNEKTLNLKIKQYEKPQLVANWSEIILGTPIKPKTFPHFEVLCNKLSSLTNSNSNLTNGLTSTTNNSNNTNQLAPLNNQQQPLPNSNQQIAQLINSLNNSTNLGGLLNLVNQMTQNNGLQNGFQSHNQNNPNFKIYEPFFVDDLNKAPINLSERSETSENGIPKLDFLAQNFNQLANLNDLSSVNNNLFNLTNGNNLNNGQSNSTSHNNSTNGNDLLSNLNKAQLNTLLQSNQLSSLLNGNANLNLSDLNQALSNQDEINQLDRSSVSLINQKLTAKDWKKFQVRKKLIDDSPHLVVCNKNSNNKLNYNFMNNPASLFEDDLCKTGKRAKQYKKRDNQVYLIKIEIS